MTAAVLEESPGGGARSAALRDAVRLLVEAGNRALARPPLPEDPRRAGRGLGALQAARRPACSRN